MVVAAHDKRLVGTHDRDAALPPRFATDAPYAGREADRRRDASDFEFVTPVDLPTGRYALETTSAHEFFDAEVGKIRGSLSLIGRLGSLVGGLVFYLVGVTGSHRLALERATLDGLTNLPNQHAFHYEVEHVGACATRLGERLALAVLVPLRGHPRQRRDHPQRQDGSPAPVCSPKATSTRRSSRCAPAEGPLHVSVTSWGHRLCASRPERGVH